VLEIICFFCIPSLFIDNEFVPHLCFEYLIILPLFFVFHAVQKIVEQQGPTVNTAMVHKKHQIETFLGNNPYNSLWHEFMPRSLLLRDESRKVVNRYEKSLSFNLKLLTCFAPPNSTVVNLTCGTGSLEVAAAEIFAPGNLSFISIDQNDYQTRQATLRWQSVSFRPNNAKGLLHAAGHESTIYAARLTSKDDESDDEDDEEE